MNKCSVALGTFDGLHLGHMAVLESVLDCGFPPVALTFSAPPKLAYINKGQLIITNNEKIQRLKSIGIKPVIMDFSKIKNMSPWDFLISIKKKYNPAVIASGFNFKFGKNASGNTELLKAFCKENSIEYKMTSAVEYGGEAISSTRIRKAIGKGDFSLAGGMLGREFSITGTVIHGDERGRTIGFPTINQVYPKELIAPRFGVYATVTEIEGVKYKSLTNVGVRPTFKSDYIISETHIFDYKGDAYGKTAKLSFLKFIRDEVKFNSLEELKNAIERDKRMADISL